jgi:hypothetical protein
VVADQLQDNVIDQLARPWPELRDAAGRAVGVLEPRYGNGLAQWALRGDALCAVGHLTSAVGAAGFRIG